MVYVVVGSCHCWTLYIWIVSLPDAETYIIDAIEQLQLILLQRVLGDVWVVSVVLGFAKSTGRYADL